MNSEVMADRTDSSLVFFSKATPNQWSYVLSQYKEVLSIRAHETRGAKKGGPQELIKLDDWYQEQLPKIIQSRQGRYLCHEELVQVTKWKLWRGKNRARLLDLVRINTENAVFQATKKAFRKLPNLNGAITALTNLKGIGPATASAVLAAGAPEHCPFMADETMAATPGIEAPDYTIQEYCNFAETITKCTDRLKELDPNSKWNPHKVELVLWTHFWIKQMKLPLLDDMPKPEASSANDVKKKEEVVKEAGSNNGSKCKEKEEEILADGEQDSLLAPTNGTGGHKSLDEDSNISVPASNASEAEERSTCNDDSSSPEVSSMKAEDGSFRRPEGNGSSSLGNCTEDSKDGICPSSEDNSRNNNVHSGEELSNLSYSNLSSDDLNSNGITGVVEANIKSLPVMDEIATGGDVDGPALKKARVE